MILLTGYKGFIGSHFRQALGEMGHDTVIGINQDNAWEFIRKFDDWDKLSLIIHNGAISSTTEKNWMRISHYNQDFTGHIFHKAIEYQIPVKYASSASVYGNQKKNRKIINPLNQYAISKLIIDYYVLDHIDRFKSIQGFRYFNVYGTGEDHKGDQASPVSKFTQQIRETGELKLFEGSEKFFRDFVWVKDVVDVVLNNNAGSGIYDVGTGNPVSFYDVAKLVAKKEKGTIKTIPFPKHLKGKYQDYTCADTSWYEHDYTSVARYLGS